MFTLILAACLLGQVDEEMQAQDFSLPFLEEDIYWVSVQKMEDSTSQRICFFDLVGTELVYRTSRIMQDDMQWGFDNERKMFTLSWQDYWSANRLIYFNKLEYIEMNHDPLELQNNAQWWQRNNKDLKQP